MKNLFLLFLLSSFILFSCKDSEDPSTEELLVGTWTIQSISVDFTIDGVNWKEYYREEYGYTDEEIEEIEATMNEDLSHTGFDVIFSSDFTYEEKDEDNAKGTWTLTNGNQLVVLFPGSEFEYSITTLGNKQMVLNETVESEFDFNQDNQDEKWKQVFTYVYSR